MDGKETNELFELLGHRAIERRELLKMVPDLGLLFVRLLQQPLRDDIGHVLTDDPSLLEPVLDPHQAGGDELELRVVEQALLQTGDEPEPDQLADLADLPEEAEVKDQVTLLAGLQVVEQLIHDEQETVVGVLLAELGHHGRQIILVAIHLIVGREAE